MQIKELIDEDSAVSPVIGVILMVAITVILAAVIGTFVLGLGDQLKQTSPTANFGYDFSAGNNDEVQITHDGGDSIDASTETLKVVGPSGTETDFPAETISAGDTVIHNYGGGSDVEIRVVWESETGENSATLATQKSP